MLRIYVLTFLFREAFAGFCTESYSCDQTCYTASRYTTSCGFLWCCRCTRYRTSSYTCTGTCYRQVCCAGYTGSSCDIPICSPVCQNGGTCISPDYCRCSLGFNPPNCYDINECVGTHGCPHTCVNTLGSFYCSCRSGYTLSSDLKTCFDVSECNTNNGGCQHTCVNTDGSFYCQCRDGYKLNGDAKTCSDIDECAVWTSGCAQTCTNTVGSYRCSCRAGYTLAVNGKSCEDVDECSSGAASCVEYCSNTLGSYSCYCGTGYVIGQDGVTCKDIDECSTKNGNCDQKCINLPGSFSCECFSGFRMDGNICLDVDECKDFTSGCSQLCINTDGSFTCGCQLGYFLSEDKKSCSDVNNCENVTCLNGGKCVDGLNKYTCTCVSGFTDKHCETDINECAIANGGCQDVCINTAGAFHCNCSDGGQLQPDGISCKSGTNDALTVFERNKLPRQLLPKACFTILLAKCKDGSTIDVYLSSTSEWYTLKSNTDIIYTLGIVFIKVNSLSIPVSIRGLEVTLGDANFDIHYGVQYGSVDGIRIINDSTPESCRPFELVEGDIFEFIAADSFIKTLLLSLFPSLPDWLRFDKTSDEVLAIQDLRSDLVYGKDMDDVSWCSGVPVIPDHLYTVFRFGSGFTLRVMEEDVVLPKPLNGNKFCLIVDLCHSYGGTIFLMIPEESRGLLLELGVFQNLKEEQNLLIHPRGIGISLTNGINANYHKLSLELWNGDRMFKPMLPNVDLWIGGDVIKYDKYFTLQGKADIYVGVPSVKTIFTSMFLEEWTGLVDITMSASPVIRFKMFGKEYSITFKLVTGAITVLLSIGGGDRVWCGDVSNPSGAFVSALIDINPFKGVPILEDWIFYNTHRLYAFVNSEPVEDPFANLKISIKDDILEVDTFLDNISVILNDAVDEIEAEFLNSSHLLIIKVKEAVIILKELISVNFNDLLVGNLEQVISVVNRIREKFIEMEQIVSDFTDALEFIANAAVKNLTETIELQVTLIRRNIHRAVNTVTSTIAKSVGNYTGFGLKYTTDIKIFKLGMVGIDIEVVYSEGNLFRCSRFDEIRNLLEGENAIRFIGRAYKEYSLGYFLSYRKGFGVGGAFSTDFHKIIIQLQAFISMIGIRATGDLFITTNGLYFYLEGNVWDIFLAQIDVSAEVGGEWYALTFRLRGRLVAKARRKRETYTHLLASNNYLEAFKKAKRLQNSSLLDRKTHIPYLNRRKRQIQTVSTSFQSSYLDALKKVITLIGDEANKRITQVQNGITVAQNGLTKAQDWFDEKKEDVRKANVYFDKAISELERAKQKVEEAKGPFNEAIRKLEEAQKNVDNLCRIRTCSNICIPGIKCRICHKSVWGVKIPYPCCDFTSCMISFPDPICVLANIACGILRAIAYAILEAAKLVIRVVLVAFDIAKAALTVAQFVVDKSRVILTIAEGILELAKVGLEYAKGILEAAKVALEAVKLVIGVAVKVLEFIIEYGLKNIIDVRNCGFEIELSTKDLPVFDVFCEVNVFRLGWTKVNLTINFKNILQSIWQAARATINAFMNLLGGVFGGRKKRDVIFEASSKMHVLLRKIRESGFSNETASYWNETINIAEDIIGFSGENVSESENRIQIFKSKCKTFTMIRKFMHDTFSSIQDVVNQSKTSVETINSVKSKLQELNNTESMTDKITVENAVISRHYASADYNMTEDDIERAITDTKAAAVNDPLMLEIKSAANISLESVDAEEKTVESIDYLSIWFYSMKNITKEYFNESECEDFKDCIFYSISTLYGLYEYETVENVSQIRDSIIDLEDNLINTFQNESTSILGAADVMKLIIDRINWLADMNVFCAKPPRLQSQPKNITSLLGSNATFYCDSKGDPEPTYKWFRDGIIMADNNDRHLVLTNVSEEDNNTAFYCTVENVVTVVTSDVAYLIVANADYTDIDECATDNGNCGQICNNTIGSFECSCLSGYTLMTDLLNCMDTNECLESNGGCDHLCKNVEGTYTCSCNAGFLLDDNSISCTDINECDVNNGGCLNKCENKDGGFKCLCHDGFSFQGNGTSCEDINECASNNGGCADVCVNEAGSFHCECKDGYTLEEDGISCQDINECYENNGGCAHKCVNEEGSYKCSCIPGFTLQDDNMSCNDINECNSNNGGCVQTCLNEAGSFRCNCTSGFLLHEDGMSCNDINECDENNGGCAHICVNNDGSFKCKCRGGFILNGDNVSCSDINECDSNNGGCIQRCVNDEGFYECECNDGFTLEEDGVSCIDVNECDTKNGGCSQTCENNAGSFQCKCHEGFTLEKDKLLCNDNNECDKNNGGCAHMCLNQQGSFKCECKPGFTLQNNGLLCEDTNECNSNNGGCAHKCINMESLFRCECRDGFELNSDGFSCNDIKECDNKNGGCEHKCINEEGSYKCQCNTGYSIQTDGVSCNDVNECDVNNGGCEHKCINEAGTFSCHCNDGFSLSDDGFMCIDINECSRNNGDCAHTCVNINGSVECRCNVGFKIQPDGRACFDNNECDKNNGGCEQKCKNEAGSYKCQCYEGYELQEDGLTCTDIDECTRNKSNCSQKCVNIAGSFECQCNLGFTLKEDKRSCIDINECVSNNGGCTQSCVNEEGSFKCKCNHGFELKSDGVSCVDINECEKNNGGCAQTCLNEAGSFKCQCDNGFGSQDDGITCVDVNECEFRNVGCDHKCINEEGSFKCQCNDGYAIQTDGVSCIDVDECDVNNGGCEHKCVNEAGTFSCHCNDGFSLSDDGFMCIDINECSRNNGDCAHTCVNINGSFECRCNEGFELQPDGRACFDINKCDKNNGGCKQKCINEAGSYKCQCYEGYELQEDGLMCTDIDECSRNKSNCSQKCVNIAGSFECQCNIGFTLKEDKRSCTDVNECVSNNGGCTQSCVNEEGSFKCKCNHGFELKSDGVSCVDINECDKNNGGCAQRCLNDEGSFKCQCDDGFESQDEGISCVDVNECEFGNGGCSHICINEKGTYRCQCNDGYRLNNNGLTCEDINECEAITDICDVTCLNFNGTYSCSCPAGYSLMDNGISCQKLVQQTLSSTLRFAISSEITESSLQDLAEYNSIANKVKTALTEYIQQFTDVPFTIMINQIRFGSIVAVYTIMLNNGTASNKAMDEIFKAVMNLTHGASVLFDGRVVQAKTVLPGNVTEPCDILKLFRGSCEEGHHCEVVGNIPTCSLVQGDAGNYMVYIAPAIGAVTLIVLTILVTLCAMVIRKK